MVSKYEAFRNEVAMDKLTTFEHIGLCEGVRNAIWSTVSSVEATKQVLIFGKLIHNERVQNELCLNGIKTVFSLDDIPAGTRVIIPAHGITREAEERLKTITSDIIDRTCPVVIKLRRLLMKVSKNHDYVILLGKKNHPEIVGAVSYIDASKVFIAENLNQVKDLELPQGSIAFLSQTTASSIIFKNIKEYLQTLTINTLSVYETICPTVIKRQEDAVDFAQKSNCVVVVGDSKSSNTYSLYELSKPLNDQTYLVQSDENVSFSSEMITSLEKAQSIAIMSGTSSPTYIIDETVRRINKIRSKEDNTGKPVLVIYGPTAVGKTSIAEEIASKHQAEIINVDSMQIYKHLTIGTAKPFISKNSPPYHLVDYIDPKELFSVASFRNDALGIIQEIMNRDNFPILAGGSNLYLSSIIDGLFDLEHASDPVLRLKFRDRVAKEGLFSLHEELKSLDIEIAQKIHPNDEKRIIRALEVIHLSKRKMSDLQKNETKALPYFFIKIGLIQNLEQLYDRIHQRTVLMLESGLLKEIDWLIQNDYVSSIERIKAHGYRELIWAHQGKISLVEALELMNQNTRRYAKRQLSWLRQRSDFHLLNTSIKHSGEWADIIMEIYEKIEKNIRL
jgi:tRNA dimethylallyltransferase